MDSLQEIAVVSTLADRLRQQGSWCGETHLQKATYFLKTLFSVPLRAEFVMYKHGPFSFDLRDTLGEAKARNFIRVEPQSYPYGPKLEVTPSGHILEKLLDTDLGKYSTQIDYIASRLGNLGVASLERLSTALFLKQENPGKKRAELVQEMVKLKPHISPVQANQAFDELQDIVAKSKDLAPNPA